MPEHCLSCLLSQLKIQMAESDLNLTGVEPGEDEEPLSQEALLVFYGQ